MHAVYIPPRPDARCVLSDSQGVLPAALLSVVLHPDQMYQITLRCTPLAVSVVRRLLVFNLDTFRIVRPISITAVRVCARASVFQ
jgi:hypothetical protein